MERDTRRGNRAGLLALAKSSTDPDFSRSWKPSIKGEPQSFDFYLPLLDTLVRVERSGDQIVIRATRDTFSAACKASFIRELAAEGFIPDHRTTGSPTPGAIGGSGILWPDRQLHG